MEVVIIIAAIIVVLGLWMWSEGKKETEGHPLEGATKKAILDVNNDGKVDLGDAIQMGDIAVKKTKKAATKVATEAKTAAKKVAAKARPKKDPK